MSSLSRGLRSQTGQPNPNREGSAVQAASTEVGTGGDAGLSSLLRSPGLGDGEHVEHAPGWTELHDLVRSCALTSQVPQD